MLSERRCRELFASIERAAKACGVRDVEAILAGGNHALTRFANNAIHQNVAEHTAVASVRVLIDGRTARATTNRLDEDGLRGVVDQAVAITRLQTADPDLVPLAESAPHAPPHTPVDRWDEATASTTPEERARAVAEAIAAVESRGQTAAGIYATNESSFAVLNSRGVFAFHAETMAQFSITAMAADSSGWAKATACRAADVAPRELAVRAAEKAAASASPMEIEPGHYTVILEAPAVLDVAGQIFGDFSATALRDERSFLTGRIGQKLFGENITIHDDAYHLRQTGAPFDGEGVRRSRLTLVERGVAREVACCRQTARLTGAAPTGHGFPMPNEVGEAPMNIVFEGGDATVEDMIAGTSRGILVTRLWYIREVDPYEKIMTGMTRDGTCLIEDGKITRGLRNFRFNQSVPEMLSNVEAIGRAARTSGEEAIDMVVPAMKVRDFHFTEVTRF